MSEPRAEAVWLAVPDGYSALPLTNIPETIEATGSLLAELGSEEIRSTGTRALVLLRETLTALAERRAVYCGIGRHDTGNGDVVASSLVVTLLEPGRERNPRLLLADLLRVKAAAGERGAADLVDLPNGPALFVERVLHVPTPPFSGAHTLAVGEASPVWQLQAHVPSADGERLATVEISVPDMRYGPLFRAMAVSTASGIAFEEPRADPLAALLG